MGRAFYYEYTAQNRAFHSECRTIETAIRQLEKRAEAGEWKCAFALYHFYGALNETGAHLPGKDNLLESARWLEVAYKKGRIQDIDRAVRWEKLRLGLGRDVDKVYFPHTPPAGVLRPGLTERIMRKMVFERTI